MKCRSRNIGLVANAWLVFMCTVAFAETSNSDPGCMLAPNHLTETAREIEKAEAATRERLGLPPAISFSSTAKRAYRIECQAKSNTGAEVKQKQTSSKSSVAGDFVGVMTTEFAPVVLNNPKLLGHIGTLVPKFRSDSLNFPGEPYGRRSSPRPLLRPKDFKIDKHTQSIATNLRAILAEVAEPSDLSPTSLSRFTSPPLTGGERDTFRTAVQKCWNVDPSSKARNVTVTLKMEMQKNGRVLPSTIELVNFTGGSDVFAKEAFQQARRAILRCQKEGYELPAKKYEHWRNVEITFDPTSMRKR